MTGEQLLEQGRREGRREGRLEAGKWFVERHLRRLGVLAPGVEARIDSATPAEIEAWIDQLFSLEAAAG